MARRRRRILAWVVAGLALLAFLLVAWINVVVDDISRHTDAWTTVVSRGRK
jgi:hypothetical protein